MQCGKCAVHQPPSVVDLTVLCCNKIAEAEAAVSVKEKKLLVMHMHVQLKLDCSRTFLSYPGLLML
jgi:hypothetical protein